MAWGLVAGQKYRLDWERFEASFEQIEAELPLAIRSEEKLRALLSLMIQSLDDP